MTPDSTLMARPARALGFLLAALVACTLARAANVGNRPQLGAKYYAIVNLDLPDPLGPGAPILRGLTGAAGIAHDRIIVSPNTHLQEWILNPRNMRVAVGDYVSTGNGNRFSLPPFRFTTTGSPDADNDGLHDLGEFIVGTDPADADSDDDGVKDGAELRNGTNPLDGRPAAVGVVAAQDTTGNAVDVAATGGLAAIADGAPGMVLFDVANPLQPVRAAQIDTAGDAKAVAFGNRLVGVADGTAGVAVIDVSNPSAAVLLHQLALGASANAIAIDGSIGYVGLADGSVVAVDLRGGMVLEQKKVSNAAVQDVTLGREALYVQVVGTLFTIDLRDGELGAVASIASSGGVGAGGRRLRLAAGGDRLYVTHTSGVNVFSLANPQAPTLLRANTPGQNGWKQMVPNGSGLALGAVDANSTNDGAHDVSLYTLAGDGSFTFATTIPTPGLASAVAIYNGLGFVADGQSGLQIVNYKAYDNLGQPPTITLSASFSLQPATSEEGKRSRVSAAVTDDVQVRNVEFYVDGERIGNDGGFPFELRFNTPAITATKTTFTLQARAFDTGGNRADSPLYTVALVPDATPPRVKRTIPRDNAYLGQVSTVLVFFSEPLRLSTVEPAAVFLRGAGADGLFATGDDPVMPASVLSFREDLNAASIAFESSLAIGKYRIEAKTTLADLAGNLMAANFQSTFNVLGFVDQDQDGVSDALELSLGLDPTKPDSDGDGILDGLEDADGDGLSNALEAFYGTALNDKDTDFDGVVDGTELTNGTNPLDADSDDDTWSDGEEATDGGNATVAGTIPRFAVIGRPMLQIENRGAEEGLANPFGAVIARPIVTLENRAAEEGVAAPIGAVVGRPGVQIENRAAEEGQAAPVGAVIARPPVQIENRAAEEGVAAPQGAVISRPPVDVKISI